MLWRAVILCVVPWWCGDFGDTTLRQRTAESVGTLSGFMPTTGGAVVELRGAVLGLSSSAVSVTYSGGSDGMSPRSYSAGACTVVVSGAVLHCPTAPGVGANYSFVVRVEGMASNASTQRLSYEAPSISGVGGPGATRCLAAGGQEIMLIGSNFGSVAAGATVTAWASPSSMDSLVFPAVSCSVVVDHTAIRCTTTRVLGASLVWHVTVEGVSNTLPVSSVALPAVHNVSVVEGERRVLTVGSGSEQRVLSMEGDLMVLDTVGGTELLLSGVNFGHREDLLTVTLRVPGGLLAANCTFQELDTQLLCVTPAGTGVVTELAVTALGQTMVLQTCVDGP